MALRFILGASGSGKSRLLFDTVLRQAQEHPDRRFIVLVPEQFTLQTQRDLVELSRRGGILNIDVLSFTRLAWRVFEQTGVEKRAVLSETGKSLLLRLVAAREKDTLPFLSGILDKPGTISELKSILSELDQYGITPQDLLELEKQLAADGGRTRLARKLYDIRCLQEVYERYQADHFITGEKLPRILCRKAPLDPTLKGAGIYLDGYTGFTPAQLDVIAVLLQTAGDVTVTVTIDPSERQLREEDPVKALEACMPDGHELFALSKRTIASLIRTAGECGVDVLPPVILDGSAGRMKSGSELAWLESHLFREGKKGREVCPVDPRGTEQILLRSCRDAYDEVVAAAVSVKHLLTEGMRYRDIAVVCGNLKGYAEYVKRVFSMYEIPYFIDRSSPVVLNPAFELVESAVDVLEKNYSYESVMRLIRTGLIPGLERSEADLLDNYLLAAGIRGQKAWMNPFTRQTKSRDASLLPAAEHARTVFMEKFLPFSEVMKKGRVSLGERAGALKQLLADCAVSETLETLRDRCIEEGRNDRASEYEQTAGVIDAVLDEAAGLIGEEEVTRAQFLEILRAGFSEAKIGIIPPGIDEVHIGDLERTRLEHIRAVIFLGLNDGFVPQRRTGGGILNDMEREFLKSRDVRLAPTAREDANIQRFYLYLTLTKPSDRLILSWSESGRDGSEMRCASVVENIRRMFPARAAQRGVGASEGYAVTSCRTGLRVLSDGICALMNSDGENARRREAQLKELLKIYAKAGETWNRTAAAILRSALRGRSGMQIDEETARALYGSVLHGSITRLEEFALCPFRQFARYGLRLSEREEFTVDTPDIGVLLHTAIERFAGRMKENPEGYTWDSIPDAVRDLWAQEALSDAAASLPPSLLSDSRRSLNTLERCGRILQRSVRTLQTQIRSGLFVPARFEVEFGAEDEMTGLGELAPGTKLQIRGRIDRIDECDDEQNNILYVKVVDYKSSVNKPDMDRFIDGEQLQLIVYMDAAARMEQKAHTGRRVVCAGMFYYAMRNPVLPFEAAGEDTEAAMVKATRVTGLVNDDPDVLRRLDRNLAPGTGSLVIPVKLKRDSMPDANSSTISAEEIDDLRAYASAKMRSIASSILRGEIAPHPSMRASGETACTWCIYADVCHFDRNENGTGYNRRAARSEQEKWEEIRNLIRKEPSEETKPGGAEHG